MFILNETTDLTHYVGYERPTDCIGIICDWLMKRDNTDATFNINGNVFKLEKVTKNKDLGITRGYLLSTRSNTSRNWNLVIVRKNKNDMVRGLLKGVAAGYYEKDKDNQRKGSNNHD